MKSGPRLLHGFLRIDGLVVVGSPHVCHPAVEVPAADLGPVAAHFLAASLDRIHEIQDSGICGDYFCREGVIHPMALRPVQHLQHLLTARPAGVAKGIVLVVPGSPEHEPHLQRNATCRVQDHAYGAPAADDHFTVEIGADSSRPAWKHGGGKLYDIQLSLMDMDVLVYEPGCQILARGIDDSSVRAHGVIDVSH